MYIVFLPFIKSIETNASGSDDQEVDNQGAEVEITADPLSKLGLS